MPRRTSPLTRIGTEGPMSLPTPRTDHRKSFSIARVLTGVFLVLYVLVGMSIFAVATIRARSCDIGGFSVCDVQVFGIGRAAFLAAWLGAAFVAVGIGELSRALEHRSDRIDASTARECPHCRELMRRDASVCLRCNRDSQAWVLRNGVWTIEHTDGRTYQLDDHTGAWRQYGA